MVLEYITSLEFWFGVSLALNSILYIELRRARKAADHE